MVRTSNFIDDLLAIEACIFLLQIVFLGIPPSREGYPHIRFIIVQFVHKENIFEVVV